MTRGATNARTKRAIIIDEWERLDRCSIGERELDQIQQVLANRFGKSAVDSPASIARILADEGADLRHPEVIEFDARWRSSFVDEVNVSEAAGPLSFDQAVAFIEQLDRRRKKESRGKGSQYLRDIVIKLRREVLSFARNQRLSRRVRDEQTEIAEWLSVWI